MQCRAEIAGWGKGTTRRCGNYVKSPTGYCHVHADRAPGTAAQEMWGIENQIAREQERLARHRKSADHQAVLAAQALLPRNRSYCCCRDETDDEPHVKEYLNRMDLVDRTETYIRRLESDVNAMRYL